MKKRNVFFRVMLGLFQVVGLLLTYGAADAQCLVGGCYANATASTQQICKGQQVVLYSSGYGASVVNDFNDGQSGVGWDTGSAHVSFENPCAGTGGDGSPHIWFEGIDSLSSTRYFISPGIDLSAGGNVRFDLRFPTQGGPIPCEGPDLPNEGVYFQYSVNAGASWTSIFYFDPNIGGSGGSGGSPYTVWQNYDFPIPVAAQTQCTQFRWLQDAMSGDYYDQWGLDNIIIGSGTPAGTYQLQWTDAVAGGSSRIVSPQITTDYVLMYGSQGDTCYDTVTVEVFEYPTAYLQGPSAPVCPNDSIIFDASASTGATPITQYAWAYNNSWVIHQTTQTPVSTYMYPQVQGTFNTKVIVTSGICSDTAFATVSLKPYPVATFSPSYPICAGLPFNLNASASSMQSPHSIVSYAWDIGVDGSIDITSAQPSAQHVIAQVDTVPVKLFVTASNGCTGTHTNLMNIYVLPYTLAGITYPGNVWCSTDAIVSPVIDSAAQQNDLFFSSPAGLYIQSYSGEISPHLSQPGNYTITYITNPASACSSSAQYSLELIQTPTVSVNNIHPFLCLGDTVVMEASGAGSYTWLSAPGLLSQSGSQVSAVPGQNALYTVIGQSAICQDSATVSVTVHPLPQVEFVPVNDVLCMEHTSQTLTGAIPSGGMYVGAGVLGNVFSPQLAGLGSHTITYSYTDSNGCTDSAFAQMEVISCLGMPVMNDVGSILVYPNPVVDQMTVVWPENISLPARLYLMSIDGKILQETLVRFGTKLTLINVSGCLAKGIYVLQIHAGTTYYSRKIVVE